MNHETADTRRRTLLNIGRAWCDRHYDSSSHLLGTEVRGAAAYAVFLCESGSEDDLQRAEMVIDAVIDQQESAANSPYCGWYRVFSDAEVSLDANWSAFCGSYLAHAGIGFSSVLSAGVTKRIGESVARACKAIQTRNVNPGYTNIAMLSASVLTSGGEWIGSAKYVEEGRRKLRELTEHLNLTGAFQEYNSPTYYAVSLSAACWMRMFCGDEEIKDLATRLEDRLWRLIAAHYHPATCQLSGPHARAYGSLLQPYAAGVKYYLYRVLGDAFDLGEHETHGHDSSYAGLAGVQEVNCPDEALELMRNPRRSRGVIGTVLTEGDRVNEAYQGRFEQTTSWLTDRYALGSVSAKDTWSQRRNFALFWRQTDGRPAAITECVWENDEPAPYGRGARFRSVQHEGKVLAVYDFGELDEEPRSAVSLSFHFEASQSADIRVDGEVRTGFPVAVKDQQDVRINFGDIQIFFRYDALDFLNAKPDAVIRRVERGFEFVLDLYRGDAHSFSRVELVRSFCAIFLQVSETGVDKDLLHDSVQGEFEISSAGHTVRWQNHKDTLEISDPDEADRPWFNASINGSPVRAQRYFESDL